MMCKQTHQSSQAFVDLELTSPKTNVNMKKQRRDEQQWVCLKSELDLNAFAIYFDSFPLGAERVRELGVGQREPCMLGGVG
ncbi:hypothetical protein Pyn_14890 [Prunus yedoensis var. nudiflora]|uniref:Uncharacterized protein n=1 Tax=Prunus yedoensis var. nudiflora TaxID=2094558 RepID=A0A314ZT39_PRUYE|nr:hypothetical protein Pyn_14890 [Prunus yedoensis var. nudiflora]